MQTYTRQDVANHASPSDGWIVIDAEVYDISNFYDLHPGGANVLTQYLGVCLLKPPVLAYAQPARRRKGRRH